MGRWSGRTPNPEVTRHLLGERDEPLDAPHLYVAESAGFTESGLFGSFTIAFSEQAFADADRIRRYFYEFVLIYPFDSCFKGDEAWWLQLDCLIG